MGTFYDSQKKQPKVWIMIAFLVVPVIVVIMFISVGKKAKENKGLKEKQDQAEDVFDKF